MLQHRLGDQILFGPFELRPAERLLLRQGTRVVVGSRAMDILICLIERQGDVVSPDELLGRVWRGVAVEAAALRVQVSALRKALGEAGSLAPYVSNVAGRGYCFVGPIIREAMAAPAAPPPPIAEVHDRSSPSGDARRGRRLPASLTRTFGLDGEIDRSRHGSATRAW